VAAGSEPEERDLDLRNGDVVLERDLCEASELVERDLALLVGDVTGEPDLDLPPPASASELNERDRDKLFDLDFDLSALFFTACDEALDLDPLRLRDADFSDFDLALVGFFSELLPSESDEIDIDFSPSDDDLDLLEGS